MVESTTHSHPPHTQDGAESLKPKRLAFQPERPMLTERQQLRMLMEAQNGGHEDEDELGFLFGTPGTALDELLAPVVPSAQPKVGEERPEEYGEWASIKQRAWDARKERPNVFYHRYVEPGSQARMGPFSATEKTAFAAAFAALDPPFDETQSFGWGVFARDTLPGRVGYQARNFYYLLRSTGELQAALLAHAPPSQDGVPPTGIAESAQEELTQVADMETSPVASSSAAAAAKAKAAKAKAKAKAKAEARAKAKAAKAAARAEAKAAKAAAKAAKAEARAKAKAAKAEAKAAAKAAAAKAAAEAKAKRKAEQVASKAKAAKKATSTKKKSRTSPRKAPRPEPVPMSVQEKEEEEEVEYEEYEVLLAPPPVPAWVAAEEAATRKRRLEGGHSHAHPGVRERERKRQKALPLDEALMKKTKAVVAARQAAPVSPLGLDLEQTSPHCVVEVEGGFDVEGNAKVDNMVIRHAAQRHELMKEIADEQNALVGFFVDQLQRAARSNPDSPARVRLLRSSLHAKFDALSADMLARQKQKAELLAMWQVWETKSALSIPLSTPFNPASPSSTIPTLSVSFPFQLVRTV